MSRAIPIYRNCKKGQTLIVGGVPIKVISGRATLLFLPSVAEKVTWGLDKPTKSGKFKAA